MSRAGVVSVLGEEQQKSRSALSQLSATVLPCLPGRAPRRSSTPLVAKPDGMPRGACVSQPGVGVDAVGSASGKVGASLSGPHARARASPCVTLTRLLESLGMHTGRLQLCVDSASSSASRDGGGAGRSVPGAPAAPAPAQRERPLSTCAPAVPSRRSVCVRGEAVRHAGLVPSWAPLTPPLPCRPLAAKPMTRTRGASTDSLLVVLMSKGRVGHWLLERAKSGHVSAPARVFPRPTTAWRAR